MQLEYYNGHLCVSFDDLTKGANPIVNKNTLKSWLRRGIARYQRKAFGEGVYALIDYKTLPRRVQEAFEERYGDPRELVVREAEARVSFEEDAFARNFYDSYTYDKNGTTVRLPRRYIDQYTLDASVLNALMKRWQDLQATSNKLNNRRKDFWAVLLDYSEGLRYDYPHKLPSSEGGLRRKLNEYRKRGYEALISRKFGNQNTTKITKEAGEYLLGMKRCMYPEWLDNAQIFEEYNRLAPTFGWKPLDSLQSVTRFFDDPRVKPLWLATQEGETKSNLYYTRKNKTIMPYRRNSVWEGDGTRANLYYKEGDKLMATDVYQVMDVATEMFIGWAFGKGETYEMQRRAYRMALERAGERPYDILTDNQGGHRRLENEGLFGRLALNYSHTQPYRPMSKLIESKFGQFQRKELHRFANFTGTNVTAKGGRPNREWLEANMELVPTYEEMIIQYELAIRRWNEGLHSTLRKPRVELYATMHNDELPAVTELDFVRIFWAETERPSTFTSSGITIQVDGKKYTYEVMDEQGLPDLRWRSEHTGEVFSVMYDPDDLTKACLFSIDRNGDKRFERMLAPYMEVVRAKQDQTAEDATRIAILGVRTKAERMRLEAEGRAIDLRMGRTYERPRSQGLSREENERIDEMASELVRKDQLGMRSEEVVAHCSAPCPTVEGEVEVVARPNRPAPRRSTLGEVLKEESLMDYGELWAKRQQGSSGERISKY